MLTNQTEDSNFYLHVQDSAASGEACLESHEGSNKKSGFFRGITETFKGHNRSEFIGFSNKGWFLVFGDILFILLAHYIATWIRFGHPVNVISFYTRVCVFTVLIYPVTMYIFDLYNVSRKFQSLETVHRIVFGITIGGSVLILIFFIVPYGQYGRGIMAIHMAIAWVLLIGWRFVYGLIFQSTKNKIPTIILGAGQSGRAVYNILKFPLSPYEVRGFIDDNRALQEISMSPTVIGTCDQLVEVARQVGATTAIMAIPKNRPTDLIRNILHARLNGIEVKDTPDIFEKLTGRIPVKHIADQWLLFADGFYLLHKEYMRKFKRLTDLVVSATVLLVTAPLLGLAALAIRLESPGPIMYTQERVGKSQQTFTIYKLRSMRHNAEASGARWAEKKDPRVTRVGKWLRLTHIDELPQIWNIFKGDMSFVGPRPERPEFVKVLEQEVPYYFIRHSVQPGLTGWAQINYKYGDSIEDATRKLEYDLYYLKNMSILLDLKIILRTMGVVLLREGAR
jgi:sugar transferase (PEP-CTERM system associated)